MANDTILVVYIEGTLNEITLIFLWNLGKIILMFGHRFIFYILYKIYINIYLIYFYIYIFIYIFYIFADVIFFSQVLYFHKWRQTRCLQVKQNMRPLTRSLYLVWMWKDKTTILCLLCVHAFSLFSYPTSEIKRIHAQAKNHGLEAAITHAREKLYRISNRPHAVDIETLRLVYIYTVQGRHICQSCTIVFGNNFCAYRW